MFGLFSNDLGSRMDMLILYELFLDWALLMAGRDSVLLGESKDDLMMRDLCSMSLVRSTKLTLLCFLLGL